MATDDELLLVRIEAQISQFERTMAKASATTERTARQIESRLGVMQSKIAGIGSGLLKSFGAGIVLGGLAELPGKIKEIVDQVAEIKEVAEKIGVTTDALQELRYAAAQAGVSSNELDADLLQFSKRVGDAAAGGGFLAKILAANGIALRNADGSMRPLTALLADYANLIKNAASQQDRLVLATNGFGKGGAEMVNVLHGGAEELQQLEQRAHSAGAVLSGEVVDSAVQVKKKFDDLETRLITLTEETLVNFTSEGVRAGGELEAAAERASSAWSRFSGVIQGALDRMSGTSVEDAAKRTLTAALVKQGVNGTYDQPDVTRDQFFPGGMPSLVAKPPADHPQKDETVTVIPSEKTTRTSHAKSPGEKFDEDLQATARRTAALQAEAKVVGEATGVQQAYIQKIDLEQEAKRRGVALSPSVQNSIDREAAGYGRAAQALEETRAKYEQMQALQGFVGDQMVGFFDAIVTGSSSAKDALKQVVAALTEAALQSAILGQGPLAGLLGTARSNGAVGGLVGALFGGFRANGGPVSPGKAYVVGEKGEPELFMPGSPGRIIPNGGNAGGAPRQVIIQIEEGALFRPVVRQEAAGVSVQVVKAHAKTIPGQLSDKQRRTG